MTKGVQFGLQYLEEGEYTINGGLGNIVLKEFEVKDGLLYFEDDKKEIVPYSIDEFLMTINKF